MKQEITIMSVQYKKCLDLLNTFILVHHFIKASFVNLGFQPSISFKNAHFLKKRFLRKQPKA